MYYFDNAATTRPNAQVVDYVLDITKKVFANPSSVHPFGLKAKQLLESSRKELANLFSLPSESVIFCSTGSEADNLAITGVLENQKMHQSKILSSLSEHPAILNKLKHLESRGVKVEYVNFDKLSGQVDLRHLKSLIDPTTVMISIHHVNSETGIIQDIESIAKIVKEKNEKIIFHVDGVQAFTKFPFDLKHSGVDLYSISAHKFHGTNGAGALIRTSQINLNPIIYGGGQEFGYRSGTENLPGIGALVLAAQIAIRNQSKNYIKVSNFASYLKKQILSVCPDSRFLSYPKVVPHILSFSIKNVPGEILLHHLAEKEIYVSRGSACNTKSKNLSSNLKALGIESQQISETIRISLAASEIPENPESLVEKFASVLNSLKFLTN